jgi:NADPH-dependent curcumin reductase CurA
MTEMNRIWRLRKRPIGTHEGLENAVATLRRLFTGEHTGKLMRHVA